MTSRERFVKLLNGEIPDRVPITLTMLIGKPGGKFIMQLVDFLECGTPIENLRA